MDILQIEITLSDGTTRTFSSLNELYAFTVSLQQKKQESRSERRRRETHEAKQPTHYDRRRTDDK